MHWFKLVLAIFFVALSVLWMYNAINAKSFMFGIVSLLCLVLAGVDFVDFLENKPTDRDVKEGRAVYKTESIKQKNDSTYVVTFKRVWKDETR